MAEAPSQDDKDKWQVVQFKGVDVTGDDAVRFLKAKGVDSECPACKFEDTAVIVTTDGGAGPFIPSMRKSGVVGPPIPTVLTICSNCGFFRSFALGAVVSWMRGEDDAGSVE